MSGSTRARRGAIASLLVSVGLAAGLLTAVPAGAASAPAAAPAGVTAGAGTLAATSVTQRTRPRASRAVKRTVGGRFCPAPGTTWGDGWGVSRGSHSHKGLDLMGRIGMPLFAIESGVIVRASRQGNGALRIVMKGVSGAKYYYGHNSRHLVRTGQRVTRGQVIALLGDTGSPGAAHLHFEYWPSGRESAWANPEPLIARLCF